MMHMTLYWGTEVTLLFNWWRTDSWPSYALTLIAYFLVSLFYQHMEDQRLRFKSASSSVDRPSRWSGIETRLLSKLGRSRRLAASLLFGFNSAVGYLLMLAIMSFNGGVLLAVVLGLSVGFYLFRSGDEDDDAIVVENSCACS